MTLFKFISWLHRCCKFRKLPYMFLATAVIILLQWLRFLAPKFEEETLVCSTPKLDPFDPSILPLIVHPSPLKCEEIQPNLFFINKFGYLQMNESERIKWNFTKKRQLDCTYLFFDRAKQQDEDFKVDTSATKKFLKPVPLETDSVLVQCTYKMEVAYAEVLNFPRDRPDKKFAHVTEENLSVIMIFVDSLSFSGMKRYLPQTFQFLTEKMGFKFFDGYNKVADNSFPNIVPILTGKRIYTQQEDMEDEFGEKSDNIHFDHWPIIWKQFAKKGYLTVFSEDTPFMGTFHLTSRGFAQKPVDYFYHNFWTMLSWTEYPKKGTEWCSGNKQNAKIQFDLVQSHLERFSELRQFMFIYFCELSHGFQYNVQKVDHIFHKFFWEMHSMARFNRSAIIFMGDHGHRSSAIRTTLIGLQEERLPVFSLFFPDWFDKKHPNIHQNMKENVDKRRLSSHFDVHETLLDILNENFDGKQRPYPSRGLSHLYPIPANRTCTNAGIPLFYCTCQELAWDPLDEAEADRIANRAGSALIEGINSDLTRNQPGFCVNFTLGQVLMIERLRIKWRAKNDAWETYRIKLEAQPKGAIFEGLVKKDAQEGIFGFRGDNDVSRLNHYGDQSDCVNIERLRKSCVCKNKV